MLRSEKIVAALLAAAMLAAAVQAVAEEGSAVAVPPKDGPLIVEGLVTPEREVELAAPSEGLVVEVKGAEGSQVKQGEVIARLSDEEESIVLRNAELQAKKLQEDFASMERLYKEKAASRDDYNKAMLAAQQAAAERDLHAIKLRKRNIVAPCDANILRIFKEPGESVQRMEKFAELVSVDRLHVTAYVDGRFLGKIPLGAEVRVLPAANAGAVWGKVIVSDPVLDPGGTVFRIKVLIDQPSGQLQPGTRVQLELPLPQGIRE